MSEPASVKEASPCSICRKQSIIKALHLNSSSSKSFKWLRHAWLIINMVDTLADH